MTDDQLQELRDYAADLIKEWEQRIRLKLGFGIYEFQRYNTTVLFLENQSPVEPEEVDPYWEVSFYGYSITTSESVINDQSSSSTVQSSYGLLQYVNSLQPVPNSTNGTLINRAATYREFEDGYARSNQTLYISIPNFQFPVRLTFQVREFNADGELVSTTTDDLNFLTGTQQTYRIEQEEPGQKLVSAIAVTRL